MTSIVTDNARGDDARVIAIRPGIRIAAAQPPARGKPFRVIPGDRDRRDFRMAYHTAMFRRAECDLLHERACVARLLGNDTDADRLSWSEGPAATERLKAALDRLAALPATNGGEVRWKKMAFGRAWLRTVDRYRESVERDVARLGRR